MTDETFTTMFDSARHTTTLTLTKADALYVDAGASRIWRRT
jgi:hypothetical protein